MKRSEFETQLVDALTPLALAWWNGADKHLRHEAHDLAVAKGLEVAVAFVEQMEEVKWPDCFILKEASSEPCRNITVGAVADKIKELLADQGVEVVVVVLPDGRLEVKRHSEWEANAQLLTACRALIDNRAWETTDDPAWGQVRAAIAKYEGKK